MKCYLDAVGDVVVVTLVVRTHAGVGEVVHGEVEGGHRDPVEAVLARLGEGQRPTEVSRVKLDGVREMGDTRGKQAVSRAFNLNARE